MSTNERVFVSQLSILERKENARIALNQTTRMFVPDR